MSSIGFPSRLNSASLLCSHQGRLRILARRAQHESANEAIEDVLQLSSVVLSVNSITLVLEIHVRLRSELEAEVLQEIKDHTCGLMKIKDRTRESHGDERSANLGRIRGRALESLRDLRHVFDHRLDFVAHALNLRTFIDEVIFWVFLSRIYFHPNDKLRAPIIGRKVLI